MQSSILLMGGPPQITARIKGVERVPCDLPGILSVRDYARPDIFIYWPDKNAFALPASLREWKKHWRPEYDYMFRRPQAFEPSPPGPSATMEEIRGCRKIIDKQKKAFMPLISPSYWRALKCNDHQWVQSQEADDMDTNIKRLCFRRFSERILASRRGAITVVVIPADYSKSGPIEVGVDDDTYAWLLFGCRVLPVRGLNKVHLPQSERFHSNEGYLLLAALSGSINNWPFRLALPKSYREAKTWGEIEALYDILYDEAGKGLRHIPVTISNGHLDSRGHPGSLLITVGSGGFIVIPEPASMERMLHSLGAGRATGRGESPTRPRAPAEVASEFVKLIPKKLNFKPWGKMSSLVKFAKTLEAAKSIDDLLKQYPYNSCETLIRTLNRYKKNDPHLKDFIKLAMAMIKRLPKGK